MAEPTLATQAEIAADQDPGDRRKRQLERRRRYAERLQGQGLLLILAGVIAIMWWSSPYFMSVDNLFTAAAVVSILGIMAVAETMLIISGEIDISIGSVMALTSVRDRLARRRWRERLGRRRHQPRSSPPASARSTAGSTVCLKINSLVVTLGMYSIVLGVAYVLSDSSTVIIDGSGFSWLGSSDDLAHPRPGLLLPRASGPSASTVLRTTALGRHIYAVGDNAESAVRAGVRADGLRIGLFVAMSLSAALAGIIVTSQLSSAAPQVGDPYLLVGRHGGRSSAARASRAGAARCVGTLIAVGILGVLQNGFALLRTRSTRSTSSRGAPDPRGAHRPARPAGRAMSAATPSATAGARGPGASRATTAASRRCRTSTCTSTAARSSASSATTAPASRRSSRSSAGR